MANAIISKLAIGFTSIGAIFGALFFSPQAANLQAQIASPISQKSNFTLIAKAPVSKILSINKIHIFQGEINRRGLAVGYHHRPNGKDSNSARMVKLRGYPC